MEAIFRKVSVKSKEDLPKERGVYDTDKGNMSLTKMEMSFWEDAACMPIEYYYEEISLSSITEQLEGEINQIKSDRAMLMVENTKQSERIFTLINKSELKDKQIQELKEGVIEILENIIKYLLKDRDDYKFLINYVIKEMDKIVGFKYKDSNKQSKPE